MDWKTQIPDSFSAWAVIPAKDVIFNPDFRKYCLENLCGQSGVNYSCPPDCGEPEEMQKRTEKYENALVLQTKWDITDYSDNAAIKKAKGAQNIATLALQDALQAEGTDSLMVGASCCSLCSPCVLPTGKPCIFPEKRFSCLSAYCIHAAKLAERCGMEYTCTDGKLALFSILFY